LGKGAVIFSAQQGHRAFSALCSVLGDFDGDDLGQVKHLAFFKTGGARAAQTASALGASAALVELMRHGVIGIVHLLKRNAGVTFLCTGFTFARGLTLGLVFVSIAVLLRFVRIVAIGGGRLTTVAAISLEGGKLRLKRCIGGLQLLENCQNLEQLLRRNRDRSPGSGELLKLSQFCVIQWHASLETL